MRPREDTVGWGKGLGWRSGRGHRFWESDWSSSSFSKEGNVYLVPGLKRKGEKKGWFSSAVAVGSDSVVGRLLAIGPRLAC